MHAMLRNKRRICVRKRVFCSEKGCLWRQPQAIRAHDLVCILNGSQVPVILRRCEGAAEQGTYRLVGQACLDGAMYGKKVDWAGDADAEEMILV